MFKHATRRRLMAGIIICLWWGHLAGVCAQGAEDSNNAFVVRIDSQFPTFKKFGGGILFAHLSGNVLIVTAKHVVSDTQPAQKILVTFSGMPKRQMNAVMLPTLSTNLDVAVISVSDSELPAGLLPLDMFPAFIVGEPGNLQRGREVFPIGHPHGVSWDVPVVPDHVTRVEDDVIRFQSNFVSEGNSGGALVTSDGILVGMVVEDEQPSAVAIRIDAVKRVLKGHYGVQLKSYAAQLAYEELTKRLKHAIHYGSTNEYVTELNSYILLYISSVDVAQCVMTTKSGMEVRGMAIGEVNTSSKATDESTIDLTSEGKSTLTSFRASELAAPLMDQLGWKVISPTPKNLTAVTLEKGSLKFTSNRTTETHQGDYDYTGKKRVDPRDRVDLVFSTQDFAKSFQTDLGEAIEFCVSLPKPD